MWNCSNPNVFSSQTGTVFFLLLGESKNAKFEVDVLFFSPYRLLIQEFM